MTNQTSIYTQIYLTNGYCIMNNTASDKFFNLNQNLNETLPIRPLRPSFDTRKSYYKTVDLTAVYFLSRPTQTPSLQMTFTSPRLGSI